MNDFDDLCINCFAYRRGNEKCPNCGVTIDGVERNRAALDPGTILAGKYLIGRVLGQGGFGITYLGFDLNLKSKIAVKEFYPNGLMARRNGHVYPINDENQEIFKIGVDNFYAEAENLARFRSNEVIVHVYDFFRANGTAYIVMENITGKSLEAVLAEHGGKISLDETLKILNPIMDALSALHDGGLLHRDIAPDNIFIAEDGRIRLIDFGAIQPKSGDSEKSALTIVKSGFAPIEQYTSSGKQGPWTDLYALAALFYRCLTGRNVPDAPDRLSGNDEELRKAMIDISNTSVRKALLKALAIDPSDRFQSIADFRSSLSEPPHVTSSPKSAKKPERAASGSPKAQEEPRNHGKPEQVVKSISKENPKADVKSSAKRISVQKPQKKSGGFPIPAALLILVFVAALVFFGYTNWIQPQSHTAKPTVNLYETDNDEIEPNEPSTQVPTEQKRVVLSTQITIPPTAHPTDMPRKENRRREIDGMIEVNIPFNGRSFWIDEREVSYQQYYAFYTQNTQNGPVAALKPKEVQANPLEPIVNIPKANAVKYCTWAGGRLPTYEEWKAAAGIGMTAIEIDKVNCGGERVSLVSSNLYPSGKFGVYDLHGNVWEWINAIADADHISQLYPTIKPLYAVIGGSWETGCAEILNAKEVLLDNGEIRDDIGFRCARDD